MAKTSKVQAMSLTRLLTTVSLLALRFSQTLGTTENSYCVCPGDQQMFECTAIGGVATVWHGSVINDCNQNNILSDEIIFSHSRILRGLLERGSCNNGSIQAQSIGVVNNNHYISQLNVTVSSDMHNKTIECDRVAVDGTRVMFRITLTTEGIYNYI